MNFADTAVELFHLDIAEMTEGRPEGCDFPLVNEINTAVQLVSGMSIHRLPDNIFRHTYVGGWGLVKDERNFALVSLDRYGNIERAYEPAPYIEERIKL